MEVKEAGNFFFGGVYFGCICAKNEDRLTLVFSFFFFFCLTFRADEAGSIPRII